MAVECGVVTAIPWFTGAQATANSDASNSSGNSTSTSTTSGTGLSANANASASVSISAGTASESWCSNSKAIMVEGASGVVVYGGVDPVNILVHVGQTVETREPLGVIGLAVLKSNKDRPMVQNSSIAGVCAHMQVSRPLIVHLLFFWSRACAGNVSPGTHGCRLDHGANLLAYRFRPSARTDGSDRALAISSPTSPYLWD
jgi:hypothetical protein